MAAGAGPHKLQLRDSPSDLLPSGPGSSDEGDPYGDAGRLGPLRRLVGH